MKEIKLIKSAYKTIGAVRVSEDIFSRIQKMARDEGVTNQDIVRAILVNCIDDIKFS